MDLWEATRTHPQHEGLAAQLMRALYRAGRQIEALAEYRRIRTYLREELGVDPARNCRAWNWPSCGATNPEARPWRPHRSPSPRTRRPRWPTPRPAPLWPGETPPAGPSPRRRPSALRTGASAGAQAAPCPRLHRPHP
ncbi:BTAD domain-containing putative transcriptional regulator [Streptomyces sp. INA 01156]